MAFDDPPEATDVLGPVENQAALLFDLIPGAGAVFLGVLPPNPLTTSPSLFFLPVSPLGSCSH